MNCFKITDEMWYDIGNAVGELLYSIWVEEKRKEITEDNWDDFVEKAVNSEEYLEKVEESMKDALTSATPAGMIGVVNYINLYYKENYGHYDNEPQLWKHTGAGSLYCHLAYVFTHERFTWKDMRGLIRKWDAEYGIDWECPCGNCGGYNEDYYEIEDKNEGTLFYCSKECSLVYYGEEEEEEEEENEEKYGNGDITEA